jgi:hypothetical protein
MTKYTALAAAALMLIVGAGVQTLAEVKTVEMKIAGYLCGN